MKHSILCLSMILCSFSASAIQLICSSPQKDLASGKSMMVYRYNSNLGTMERFAYVASRSGYSLFGSLDNLAFTDDLYNMVPLRRAVTATSGDQEVLRATWSNGNKDFKAQIAGEGPKVFSCRSKESHLN